MALIMWLIMRWSCLLSYTDHVPLEAINKELSRHESHSQQAIIMELSCEESSRPRDQTCISYVSCIRRWVLYHWSPGGSVRRVCLQCRRPGFNPWIGKIPWRRKWLSSPVFLPGEFHGQRSLVGCSPWGHKESDVTEWLTLSLPRVPPGKPKGYKCTLKAN